MRISDILSRKQTFSFEIFPPKGDAFAARNAFALAIDEKVDPPMFQVSDTHFAATWLLHPDAPKVEMPVELQARIERARKDAEEYL